MRCYPPLPSNINPGRTRPCIHTKSPIRHTRHRLQRVGAARSQVHRTALILPPRHVLVPILPPDDAPNRLVSVRRVCGLHRHVGECPKTRHERRHGIPRDGIGRATG